LPSRTCSAGEGWSVLARHLSRGRRTSDSERPRRAAASKPTMPFGQARRESASAAASSTALASGRRFLTTGTALAAAWAPARACGLARCLPDPTQKVIGQLGRSSLGLIHYALSLTRERPICCECVETGPDGRKYQPPSTETSFSIAFALGGISNVFQSLCQVDNTLRKCVDRTHCRIPPRLRLCYPVPAEGCSKLQGHRSVCETLVSAHERVELPAQP
jgi:hypothetical protein